LAELPEVAVPAPGAAMRVLIADDHALFRAGLRSLLESHGIEVAGEARTGTEAVDLAVRLQPDIVLMDVRMPDLDGIEATRRLLAGGSRARVVVLTAVTEDETLVEALRAGAEGYLRKDLDGDVFFELLAGVLEDRPAFTPELLRKVLQAFTRLPDEGERQHSVALTQREIAVLQLMVDGVTSNRRLSRRLAVSESTVKFHVRNILDKLHQHNRAQAVAAALRDKLVEQVQ
jgi:DNA-binding NarL/FixJ family response regulator